MCPPGAIASFVFRTCGRRGVLARCSCGRAIDGLRAFFGALISGGTNTGSASRAVSVSSTRFLRGLAAATALALAETKSSGPCSWSEAPPNRTSTRPNRKTAQATARPIIYARTISMKWPPGCRTTSIKRQKCLGCKENSPPRRSGDHLDRGRTFSGKPDLQ
jgi:hypothetical protein